MFYYYSNKHFKVPKYLTWSFYHHNIFKTSAMLPSNDISHSVFVSVENCRLNREILNKSLMFDLRIQGQLQAYNTGNQCSRP